MLEQTLKYFTELPLWELLAVIAALFYVVLAAKENIWCWPAALVSTVIYTVIFYDVYLWMDSLLQVYYIAMAIYGWYCWRTSKTDVLESTAGQKIQTWSLIVHVKYAMVLTAISLALGWFMATFTPADFPYLDSLTTVFAVFSTYLVAKKVLENWLYWIAIDALSIYLYIEKGLQPTAVLFVLYVFIAAIGYYYWYRKYHNISANNAPENITA